MDVRHARMDDSELLYQWRVNGEDAEWYEGQKTTRVQHDKWFADRLRSPSVRIWIVENEHGPIGTIRLDSNDELSVYVDEAWRNMGYGTRMIQWACDQAEGRVKASVDGDNLPALRAFTKAGFALRPDIDFLLWRPS